MSHWKWQNICISSMLIAIFAVGCGPVKFSAKSQNRDKVEESGQTPTNPTDPTNPGTPTNPTNPGTPTTPGTPTDPTNPGTVTSLRNVNTSTTVQPKNNLLDIVLVVDDSNSMLEDNIKLASKLQSFLGKLERSSLDWQMCLTTTRAINNSSVWGASTFWQPTPVQNNVVNKTSWILKKNTFASANLTSVFENTMNFVGAGWAGSDDERAIYAMWYHAFNGDLKYSGNSGCYRRDSAVTYIIISDEDERSVGGEQSRALYPAEYKALETKDQPSEFVRAFKETFGNDRRFTVNSIIVEPGDVACKNLQDAGSARSHYGKKYAELSRMTGGSTSSICSADFSVNLDTFVSKIEGSLRSLPLECEPYNNSITVSFSQNVGSVTSTLNGASVVFSKEIPYGTIVNLSYKCTESRTPSSVTLPISFKTPSLWEKFLTYIEYLIIW